MRHLIDIMDLSIEELDEMIAEAKDIIAQPEKYAHVCAGKKLATLFFEPSTRTRLTSHPFCFRSLATTKPSPPLLPLPQYTFALSVRSDGCGLSRVAMVISVILFAAIVPAFSII